MSMPSHEEKLDRCEEHITSDYLLDALGDFLNEAKRIREGAGASSLLEAKILIVGGLIQFLTKIALEAARIVEWSHMAEQICAKLRIMLDTQKGMCLVYRSQQAQKTAEMPRSRDLVQSGNESFKLEVISSFNPALYDSFIRHLNDLITLYENFRVTPRFVIATQAIRIGRYACTLAHMLYDMLNDDHSVEMRRLGLWFSRNILLKPDILHEDLIFRVHSSHYLRDDVWTHLACNRQYEGQFRQFEKYNLYVVKSIFDSNTEICAFALLNHDVFDPFPTPGPDTQEDFRLPIVLIEHFEVRPQFRRCGIGSLLMRFIKRMAMANGYSMISIHESGKMLETLGFWACMKFRPSPVCSGWQEIDLDKLRAAEMSSITPAST